MSGYDEFRFSNDGRFVAAATVEGAVRVCRLMDRQWFDLPNASYSSGGRRLAIDSNAGVLFSGAYYQTGVSAYEVETGKLVWHRRDLKKVQHIACDTFNSVVYCAFEDKATKPLNALSGREKPALRGLKDFYFSDDSGVAVFEFDRVRIENRPANTTHGVSRESWGIVAVGFTNKLAVLSWISGPVTAVDVESGDVRWMYATEGAHAFNVAPTADREAVWIVETPYEEPPWHRLRRLSASGVIERELRCSLGANYGLIPYHDSIICSDLSIVRIDELC